MEPGRHALQRARVERAEEQRLDQVVAVVAERDLGAAHLDRGVVEDAAAQPRADRAGGLPLGDEPPDHRVGVAVRSSGTARPPP